MVALIILYVIIVLYALCRAFALKPTTPTNLCSNETDTSSPKAQPQKCYTGSLNSVQLESIMCMMKQVKESADIVNRTLKPEIFFGRLNFLIETLMELQGYEGRFCFGEVTPTSNLDEILTNIETTVNAFIHRSYISCLQAAAKLKTEKGREDRVNRYFDEIKYAFENAQEFWQGDKMRPRYSGALFTERNYDEVLSLEGKTIDWSEFLPTNVTAE